MKIIIIGNIGCGKTTIGKKLSEFLGYKFIQIDEIRNKVLTYRKVSLEYLSLYLFLKIIEEVDNIIVEFSGAGCHKYAIKRALELSEGQALVVILRCNNLKILKDRAKQKRFKYTNPFDIDINKHINYIHNELENSIKSSFWTSNNIKNIVIDVDGKTIDDIIKEITEKIKQR